MTIETQIERHLKKVVKEHGGITRKMTYAACKGAPDRLVMLPDRLIFVELKRPIGGRLSAQQRHEIKLLKSAGAEVHVLNTKEKIDELFK